MITEFFNRDTVKCLELYDSLRKAEKQAGGSGHTLSLETLPRLSLSEFLWILATNNIRFVFDEKAAKE